MRQVFDCVYGLLLAPEPDDPLDSVLAAQFYEDRSGYDRAAQEMTRQAAGQTLEELRSRICGDEQHLEDADHPKHLVCPLTLQLFEDPVSTRYGHSYERAAITQYLVKVQRDPLTQASLKAEDLFENFAL